MPQKNGDVLAIQVGTADPVIYKDVSEEQCLKIITEKAPEVEGKLRDMNARLTNIRNDILTDPDRIVDYYLLQAAQARADEMLSLEFEDLSEEERVNKVEQFHKYTSIGSTLLYEHQNFGGSTKFFGVTWPNMKWWPYRFNDRASSAKAWGVNVLFEHTWYRGRRLWLVGLPYVQFGDLSVFGFNDIASSIAGP